MSTRLPSGDMHGTRDEVAPLPPLFEIVRRGFHPEQVIDHVTALKARVATIGTERNGALQRADDLNEQVEKLRREAAEATSQLERLHKEASETAAEVDRLQKLPLTGATGRIQRMLQIAEDEAAELKAVTEQEITSLRESARAEADRLLTQTRQQCERLEAESNALREAVEAETAADLLLTQARQECERLEAESNARRQAVEAETAARQQRADAQSQAVDAETAARHQRAEEQAERDIARREAETDAWIQDYQTHSVAALGPARAATTAAVSASRLTKGAGHLIALYTLLFGTGSGFRPLRPERRKFHGRIPSA